MIDPNALPDWQIEQLQEQHRKAVKHNIPSNKIRMGWQVHPGGNGKIRLLTEAEVERITSVKLQD